MPDELHQPLGKRPAAAGVGPSGRPAGSLRGWTYGVLGLLAAGAGVYVARYGDPNGGWPRATARIEQAKPAEKTAAAPREPETTATIETRGGERHSGQEIERNSGVKVTRAGNADAPGALIIQLDQPAGVRLTPAPDKRLVERDRFGLLPRTGPDGSKPYEIYARPVVSSSRLKSDAPRIALVVGGMGLSSTTTQAAFEKLPADVSFAFAPYGGELAAEASRAREQGHETFLQAPMEPFDWPQNNPGPHTLNLAASSEETLTDMRWLMSRFTGYVGVINFLGARFMANESALAPVMREFASRGLAFVDDGSAPQSLALAVAASVGAPRARADLVIDADRSRDKIEAALSKLEAIARQKGSALGVASAIPQSIESVARFARSLEGRGIALVPASALLAKGAGAQAENRRP